MARNSEGFDPDVKLPPELKVAHVRKAIEYIERKRQNSLMCILGRQMCLAHLSESSAYVLFIP